jgi:hypothetical protein
VPKIIISYRRQDSQDIAMRIRDRLAPHYGQDSVFTDIDSIPLGANFLRHITAELTTCDALVAVVGPRWLDAGRESGQGIMEEMDFIRLEVEGALKREIPVIPVLVGGMRMPKPSELPDSIRDFAFQNGAIVDSGINFHNDMNRVIRALDEHFGIAHPSAAPTAIVSPAQRPSASPTLSQLDNRKAIPPEFLTKTSRGQSTKGTTPPYADHPQALIAILWPQTKRNRFIRPMTLVALGGMILPALSVTYASQTLFVILLPIAAIIHVAVIGSLGLHLAIRAALVSVIGTVIIIGYIFHFALDWPVTITLMVIGFAFALVSHAAVLGNLVDRGWGRPFRRLVVAMIIANWIFTACVWLAWFATRWIA